MFQLEGRREPVVYPDEFPWTAVCRLVAVFPNRRTEQSSGALVGSRFAVTAARALFREEHGGLATAVTFAQGDRTMRVARSGIFIEGEHAMLKLPEELDDPFALMSVTDEQLRALGSSWLTGWERDQGGRQMWTAEDVLARFDAEHLFTNIDAGSGAALTTEIDHEIVLLGLSLGGNACVRISDAVLAQYRAWMR